MTRTEAIASAGAAIADGIALRNSLPPRQAAELAWTPTGPPVDELERMIRAGRGQVAESALMVRAA